MIVCVFGLGCVRRGGGEGAVRKTNTVTLILYFHYKVRMSLLRLLDTF